MSDEALEIVKNLHDLRDTIRAHEYISVSYAGRDLDEAADIIENLSAELEEVKRERDRYWAFIRDMGCESCSGDCDKCVDGSAWTWSGEVSQNADS